MSDRLIVVTVPRSNISSAVTSGSSRRIFRCLPLVDEVADQAAFVGLAKVIGQLGAHFAPDRSGADPPSLTRAQAAAELGLAIDDPTLAIARLLVDTTIWDALSGDSFRPDTGDRSLGLNPAVLGATPRQSRSPICSSLLRRLRPSPRAATVYSDGGSSRAG